MEKETKYKIIPSEKSQFCAEILPVDDKVRNLSQPEVTGDELIPAVINFMKDPSKTAQKPPTQTDWKGKISHAITSGVKSFLLIN